MSGTRIPADLARRSDGERGIAANTAILNNDGKKPSSISTMFDLAASAVRRQQPSKALACVSCSLRKASRTQARDPVSSRRVRLFNPRQDAWIKHFEWSKGCKLKGLTPIGRATVAALKMNGPRVVRMRKLLAAANMIPDADE